MSESMFTDAYQMLIAKLKRARRELGLTQVEVAQRLKTQQSMISKIESGERRVDIVELATLSELYGIPLDFVLSDVVEHARKTTKKFKKTKK